MTVKSLKECIWWNCEREATEQCERCWCDYCIDHMVPDDRFGYHCVECGEYDQTI